MTQKSKIVSTVAVFVLLYLTVATMSYHDTEEQSKYCQSMVEQGAWPSSVCS